MSGTTYADAGVDVSVEAKASRILYKASQRTFVNRRGSIGEIIIPFDDFSGVKVIDISQLPPGSYLSLGFDGAGTKVQIPQRLRKYSTIAHDLLAMVCDDAVLRGGEPILVGSILDIKSLGSDERYLPIIQELADGYVEAAKEANVAIINGEIAQMGASISGYGDFPFNWGAACIWCARKDRLFTGREITARDSVVLLREHGFRANGLSLVRKIFEKEYGEEWHTERAFGTTLGEAVLTPSTIYSRFITHLHGGFSGEQRVRVTGIVHITGGGIPEKFGRVLRPSGLGVDLSDVWEPSPAMWRCQSLGKVSDHDAYSTWNMGQGMGIITPEPHLVMREAEAFGIEAKLAGSIVQSPAVHIQSAGNQAFGQALTFLL